MAENNCKKYFNVLRNNEDLSYGGLRTLKLIEDEFDRMYRQNAMNQRDENDGTSASYREHGIRDSGWSV
jgi:hypothetical protein